MKCDELKAETIVPQGCTITLQMYPKAEADAAIAELKARIQLDDDEMAGFLQLEEECGGGDLRNYIAELKAKLDEKDKEIESLKESHYAEMVDAGMRERRLRRAFYKACANWAHIAVAFFSSYVTKNRWRWMELKCLKKVEEYK